MLKEGYEDIFRHRQDTEVNKTKVEKFEKQSSSFIYDCAENIAVGDILKINEDESIPADVLILRTYDDKGVAFVDTMNLDGETNLKEKLALEKLKKSTVDEISNLEFLITTDAPSPDLAS